ncbi:MAG: hypothetical protein IJS32_06810 [Kiritimatiellae bacterium]|nr:hypothetical protein [Kiritimatiellia bacterium]
MAYVIMPERGALAGAARHGNRRERASILDFPFEFFDFGDALAEIAFVKAETEHHDVEPVIVDFDCQLGKFGKQPFRDVDRQPQDAARRVVQDLAKQAREANIELCFS